MPRIAAIAREQKQKHGGNFVLLRRTPEVQGKRAMTSIVPTIAALNA